MLKTYSYIGGADNYVQSLSPKGDKLDRTIKRKKVFQCEEIYYQTYNQSLFSSKKSPKSSGQRNLTKCTALSSHPLRGTSIEYNEMARLDPRSSIYNRPSNSSPVGGLRSFALLNPKVYEFVTHVPKKTNIIKTKKFLNLKTLVSKRDSSYYTDKDKVVSITYEEIGLFPRSFSRVLDRFLKQLFSDVDNLVIQEYRFYRYLFLTTIKTIFILVFVPFLVNFAAKNYVVKPITEYFWNTNHPEIFLNSYEQKRAFAELEKFEQKIYFETLVESNIPSSPSSGDNHHLQLKGLHSSHENMRSTNHIDNSNTLQLSAMPVLKKLKTEELYLNEAKANLRSVPVEDGKNLLTYLPTIETPPSALPPPPFGGKGDNEHFQSKDSLPSSQALPFSVEKYTNNNFLQPTFASRTNKNKDIAKIYQQKTIELATYYNNHSIEAITNFFADLLSLCTLLYLLITLSIQINITKSFLLEVFFGLDDSKKSLLILLVTDLLVGYHSSNLWELFFEFIFNHYGIPESQTGIFLLVATLPVLLDVLFKYLIFRHLNRSSPATVATYQAIIE